MMKWMMTVAMALVPLLGFAQGAGPTTPPVAPGTPAEAPEPPPALVDAAVIDAALKQLVDSGQIVGVSALVFERGKEAYFGAFGFADRENEKPMTRDTVAQIFSMTKPITGVALMQLYERGKFGLDDPLEQHAPEFANLKVFAGVDPAGQPIYEEPRRKPTIRDVLRHTAGLTAGNEDQTPVGAIYRELRPDDVNNTLPEFAAKLAQVPLAYQPGTRWLYSPAVNVQAYLVQKISGVPFDDYLRMHIFKPLGMSSTRHTILPTDPDRPQLAAMYTRHADGTFSRQSDEEAYRFNGAAWPLKPGSSGLVSTVDDYMKFARMLAGGGKLVRARIIKPETVRLMATDMLPQDLTSLSWLPGKGSVGFGIDFAVRTAPPKDAKEASGQVGEFFWDGAANTLFWVDPVNDIVAVLFTQYRPFGGVPLHKSFRDAVYHNVPQALAQDR
jgi:CubicO group peptidase (beta-lactamase class C family)